MRVSVLIPTYNRRRYLLEALESARGQSHDDLEILVSDDGSTDGSQALVSDIASRDRRVRLLTGNKVRGIFTNMNYLVAASTGMAFCLVGDDDRLRPEYVAALAAPLVADSRLVATFCDHSVIDSEGTVVAADTATLAQRYGRDKLPSGTVADPVSMVWAQSMCIGFSLFRSSVFQNERFDLDAGPAADWDYLFRAIAHGPVAYVAERLGEYRVHPGTATNTKRLAMGQGIAHVLRSRRFGVASQEALRRARLRDTLLELALVTAAEQSVDAGRLLLEYFRLAGSPFDARIAASVVLGAVPRPVARLLRARIHRRRGPIGVP